jgi:hypothetical protein
MGFMIVAINLKGTKGTENGKPKSLVRWQTSDWLGAADFGAPFEHQGPEL